MSPSVPRFESDAGELEALLVKSATLLRDDEAAQVNADATEQLNSWSRRIRANLTILGTAVQGLRAAAANDPFRMNPMQLGMEDTYQRQIADVRVFVQLELAPHLHEVLQGLAPDRAVRSELAELLECESRVSVSKSTVAEAARGRASELAVVEHGLSTLQTTLNRPHVRTAIAQYETHFRETREEVDKLASYKALHDQIHTLQFSFFVLEDAVNRSTVDDDALGNLAQFEIQIRQVVDDSRRIADGATFTGLEIDWIDELNHACDDLREGSESCDLNRLRSAVRRVNRILATRPELINRGLIDVARGLPLNGLEQALAGVQASLARDEPMSNQAQDIAASRAALAEISRHLRSLVDEHDAWQATVIELRRLDGALGWDPTEFEFFWPDLKRRVERLYAADTALWVCRLSASAQAVEIAAGSGLPKLKQAFAVYRRHAEKRFWDVDCTLKVLCEQLQHLDKPLCLVLTTMGWRDDENEGRCV